MSVTCKEVNKIILWKIEERNKKKVFYGHLSRSTEPVPRSLISRQNQKKGSPNAVASLGFNFFAATKARSTRLMSGLNFAFVVISPFVAWRYAGSEPDNGKRE